MEAEKIVKVIPRIKVFHGVNKEQAQKIAELCKTKKISKGAELFKAGDPSEEMYILLSGQLNVAVHSQTIANINMLGVVGEVGAFTRQPRSATVTAADDSLLLVIRRKDLFNLIKEEESLGLNLCLNIIQIISEYLIGSNHLFEFYYMIGQGNTK